MRFKLFNAFALSATLALTGCMGGGESSSADAGDVDVMTSAPSDQPPGGRALPRDFSKDVLIYAGTATAYGDSEALVSIVESKGLSYDTVSSSELDAMSVEQLADYGVIVWPGGFAGQMSSSLDTATRGRIRQAVREKGVSFVGICAGAFIAVSPSAKGGDAGPDWGFALVDEETMPYYHLEDEGTTEAMVTVEMAGGQKRDLVWWGGPYLPEKSFPNGTVARYSDTGEPAIAQTWAGNGFMILSGPHPEAPEDWRGKLGLTDEDGMDQDIAWDMIEAALKQKPMPTV